MLWCRRTAWTAAHRERLRGSSSRPQRSLAALSHDCQLTRHFPRRSASSSSHIREHFNCWYWYLKKFEDDVWRGVIFLFSPVHSFVLLIIHSFFHEFIYSLHIVSVCTALVCNGETQEEEALRGRRRADALLMLCDMCPSHVLTIRSLCVSSFSSSSANFLSIWLLCINIAPPISKLPVSCWSLPIFLFVVHSA